MRGFPPNPGIYYIRSLLLDNNSRRNGGNWQPLLYNKVKNNLTNSIGVSNYVMVFSPRQAAVKSPSKILVVSPAGGHHHRLRITFSILQAHGFAWDFRLEGELDAGDLTGCALLVLYRCRQARTVAFLRLARKKGIPVLYELDDDLLAPPPDESWGELYQKEFCRYIMETLLAEADLVKAGSPELAKRLEERGFSAFYQPYAAHSCPCRQERGKASLFHVGYFGTPSPQGY